jgi:hypothetical protein
MEGLRPPLVDALEKARREGFEHAKKVSSQTSKEQLQELRAALSRSEKLKSESQNTLGQGAEQ